MHAFIYTNTITTVATAIQQNYRCVVHKAKTLWAATHTHMDKNIRHSHTHQHTSTALWWQLKAELRAFTAEQSNLCLFWFRLPAKQVLTGATWTNKAKWTKTDQHKNTTQDKYMTLARTPQRTCIDTWASNKQSIWKIHFIEINATK